MCEVRYGGDPTAGSLTHFLRACPDSREKTDEFREITATHPGIGEFLQEISDFSWESRESGRK